MIRSLLYVPGNTPRFLEKAGQRGADVVIIDLEDAVPEAGKTEAREMLAQSVPMVAKGGLSGLRPREHDRPPLRRCRRRR